VSTITEIRTMKILGIAGSLRAGSYNRQLLQLAASNLPDGVEVAVWEGLRDLPAFDEDAEGTPSLAVAGFRAAVADANAVLIATPEYNGSIPGALKNALDWGSRPRETAAFRGKPVAVIGASPGSFGGVWAQAETRKVLGLMGSRVVGAELSLGKAHERLLEPDAELVEQLRAVIDLLVDEAGLRAAAA
jgi:chromate reductase